MSEKVFIYLDDVRTPKDENEWVVVRNYDEFVKTLTEIGIENIGIISLDHDLGETSMKEYFNNVITNFKLDYTNIEEKTGLDCAKWLVEECMQKNLTIPLVYSHSANPIGAANIIGYINAYLAFCKKPQNSVRVLIPFN